MARMMRAITRALREVNDNTTKDGVHFHAGPGGPYVCENARCVSPGLDLERS
jgi:hypothetical protein